MEPGDIVQGIKDGDFKYSNILRAKVVAVNALMMKIVPELTIDSFAPGTPFIVLKSAFQKVA